MAGKRNSPDFLQICFYVPKDTGIEFKTQCTKKQLEQSEVISDLISHWLICNEAKAIDGNDFIRMIASRRRPTAGERACLADTLDVSIDILDKIIDCLFEESKQEVMGNDT